MNLARLISLFVIPLTGSAILAADWPQFRGTGQRSVAEQAALPTEWSVAANGPGKNIAWRSPLPGRGVSSPIVADGRVFITASSGPTENRLHVLSFNAASGQRLWERQFWATGRTLCHPTSAVAANTPASDGRCVVAMFSSNDIVCLDLDGNLRWLRGITYDIPTAANDVGLASSPLIVGDRVIVQIDSKGASLAAALDLNNGETLWQIEREREMNWTSPSIGRDAEGRELVLLQSASGVTAHDPATGRIAWKHDIRTGSGIPSITCDGQTAYVPAEGLTALSLASSDGSVNIAWKSSQLACGNASPVIVNGRVYALNRAGALTCGDANTGDVVWRLRLKGTFWATPVVSGERLFAFNSEGLGQVVDITQGETIAESALGEETFGSPAIAGNALFVRTAKHLYKIAEPGSAAGQ